MMRSNVYYMVEELKHNNEIEEFTNNVYIEFCKSNRYKNLIKELGDKYNVKSPGLYFHYMSTYEFIKISVENFIKYNDIISYDMIIDYVISNISNGNIKLSVLDKNIIYNMNILDKHDGLYKILLSKNIYGKTTELYRNCNSL